MAKYVMVLNDLETFTSLDGCMIIEIPDDFDEDTLVDGDKEHDLISHHRKYMWEDTLYDGCKLITRFQA